MILVMIPHGNGVLEVLSSTVLLSLMRGWITHIKTCYQRTCNWLSLLVFVHSIRYPVTLVGLRGPSKRLLQGQTSCHRGRWMMLHLSLYDLGEALVFRGLRISLAFHQLLRLGSRRSLRPAWPSRVLSVGSQSGVGVRLTQLIGYGSNARLLSLPFHLF